MTLQYLQRESGPDLAYVLQEAQGEGCLLPPVMFCGGYRSDMGGTKALFLEAECRKRGQGYVRFDYRGHGQSGGRFEDGLIGDWAQDARDMLDHVFKDRRVIVVGSSMGGWIGLLLGRWRPERMCGLIGIAAAPDFTDTMLARLSPAQRATLEQQGALEVEGSTPEMRYYLSMAFFTEARENKIFDQAHRYDFPIRLIQGKQDVDVPWRTAEAIKTHFADSDVQIEYVVDGEHRLSRPEDLFLLGRAVNELSGF